MVWTTSPSSPYGAQSFLFWRLVSTVSASAAKLTLSSPATDPGHHYQFTENNSSPKQPLCSQRIALNPARSESLQGKFCYCGLITVQKWFYLFVISVEVAVQCCALLCTAPCSWAWAWEWCVLVRQLTLVMCFQTAVWKSCCCKEALITHLNP